MTVPSKSTIKQGGILGAANGLGTLRVRDRRRQPVSSHHTILESVLKVFVVSAGIIVVYNGYHSYEEGELNSRTSSSAGVGQYSSNNNILKSSTLTLLSSSQTATTSSSRQQHQEEEERTEEDDGPIDRNEIPTTTAFKQGYSKYHTVFSTGCSTYQDWQSYVFFYHVMKSGQEGHVTRIASGCTGKDLRDIHSIFDKEIKSMTPNHHLHLTPDYSRVHLTDLTDGKAGRPFKYFNKPYGMKHWMQNALGYPHNHEEHDDSIIILLDPDQILLRPFTDDFTNSSEKYRTGKHKLKVEHGSPFAQQYGYGIQWKTKVDLNHVFKGQPTHASTISNKEAFDYYAAMGPPYIATAKDMWSLVSTWCEIVPRVHDVYPHLLAEMFGYNLAAAHLGLRHTIAHSFMVSDMWAGMEGWDLVTAVDAKDVCHNFPKSEYPHVIHYCQRYHIGKWFIGKHRLRDDFISCRAPLLAVPPADVALRYKYALIPGTGERKDLKEKGVKQQAFMLCHMIDALNAAAKFYKDQQCTGEDESLVANYNYSYVFWNDMSLPEDSLVLPS